MNRRSSNDKATLFEEMILGPYSSGTTVRYNPKAAKVNSQSSDMKAVLFEEITIKEKEYYWPISKMDRLTKEDKQY